MGVCDCVVDLCWCDVVLMICDKKMMCVRCVFEVCDGEVRVG